MFSAPGKTMRLAARRMWGSYALRVWLAASVGLTPLFGTLVLASVVNPSAAIVIPLGFASAISGSLITVLLLCSYDRRARDHASEPTAELVQGYSQESRDPLTGLHTFQPFSQRLFSEHKRVVAGAGQAALVLIDISQLAGINHQFGAESGDEVITHVAACLTATKRGSDSVARVGDDEFAVLLPECDRFGAESFVKRAQSWLGNEPLRLSKSDQPFTLRVGICAGIAVCSAETLGPDHVLTAAIESLRLQREERDLRQSRWTEAA